jgi:hypothetical protein
MVPARLHASYSGKVTASANFRVVVAAVIASALLLTGCTTSEPEPAASPTPSPSASPTLTPRQLTATERAQQLSALAPDGFKASYRLTTRRNLPNAKVLMRVLGERFRLDVTRGRTTAVLAYGRRGVVSCRIRKPRTKKDRVERTCFLVAKTPRQLPTLFDPGIQRLFRPTTLALSRGGRQVTVRREGTWKAPHGLGVAECFAVRGERAERGTYCYLAEPGPNIGLLARAVFPSGTLELRDVSRALRKGAFRPPVRPTPLPTG